MPYCNMLLIILLFTHTTLWTFDIDFDIGNVHTRLGAPPDVCVRVRMQHAKCNIGRGGGGDAAGGADDAHAAADQAHRADEYGALGDAQRKGTDSEVR